VLAPGKLHRRARQAEMARRHGNGRASTVMDWEYLLLAQEGLS